MKLIASGVTFSAAIVRSPSFSRSSSSTTMTISPRRMASIGLFDRRKWALRARALGDPQLRRHGHPLLYRSCRRHGSRPSSMARTTYFPIMSHSRFTRSPTPKAAERRGAERERDDLHVELRLAQPRDRQADAVDSHRSLADEERRERRRIANRQPVAVAPRGRIVLDDADAVHVPEHEMAAEPSVEPHRPLQVDGLSRLQRAERRDASGLRADVEMHFAVVDQDRPSGRRR